MYKCHVFKIIEGVGWCVVDVKFSHMARVPSPGFDINVHYQISQIQVMNQQTLFSARSLEKIPWFQRFSCSLHILMLKFVPWSSENESRSSKWVQFLFTLFLTTTKMAFCDTRRRKKTPGTRVSSRLNPSLPGILTKWDHVTLGGAAWYCWPIYWLILGRYISQVSALYQPCIGWVSVNISVNISVYSVSRHYSKHDWQHVIG